MACREILSYKLLACLRKLHIISQIVFIVQNEAVLTNKVRMI